MDIVRTTRYATKPRNSPSSESSGKSEQSAESTPGVSQDGLIVTEEKSKGVQSPKTSKLISTENGAQPSHSTNSKGATTSNGKSNNYNYIPPVQSREHNTRSKNGVRKEFQSVSVHFLC